MNQQIEPLASHPAPPCAVVIFGASGDLTKRKLVPSLYNLASIGMLPADFSIIGVARRELSHDDFREQMTKDMQEFATQKIDPALWDKFRERIYYCQGEFDDPETYGRLAALLDESEKKHGTQGNALFYLSVQPTYFAPIAEQLKQHDLAEEKDGRWRRVIVEKPFGHDLASARELNSRLSAALAESQIFRIDHYLGKETAQNILVFRVGNGDVRADLEPASHRPCADHGGRVDRRRGPRRVLRNGRRIPRRDPEPYVHAHGAHRHGAAELASTARRCATRRSSCSRPCAR